MDVASQIDPTADFGRATSYPGAVHTSVGGVGHNIARAARLLGADTALVAALGQDAYGASIADELTAVGVDTRFLQYPGAGARTAVYNALHGPDGDLIAAVADMGINQLASTSHIEGAFQELNPAVVGLDANLPSLALASVLLQARACRACTVFEPTSVPKCTSVLAALSAIERSSAAPAIADLVHVATPNGLELRRLAAAAIELGLVAGAPAAAAVDEMAERHYSLDAGILRDAMTVFPVFQVLVVKLGKDGVAVLSPSPRNRHQPLVRHIPPLAVGPVVNSNGAGDSLVGAVLAMLHRRPALLTQEGHLDLSPGDIDSIVRRAQRAAILALGSASAISDQLHPRLLDED
ncbi:hypothetical protein IWQ57_001457 [Coemansia nantahalensis]|uniref:Uncharacterized protein n=1 Tax=Coemansia nantahalensis TaxID=2789366 RepID=A0ACC1K3X7_9FUNG|nr:hypothetical protein IWQ57_001457 [Coemansia nantahalensis]